MSNHSINWFEICSTDLARATRFYEAVLDVKLKLVESGGVPNAIFPRGEPGDVTGSLIFDGRRAPSTTGTLVYLNANSKLVASLARVASAGGKVVLPLTSIGEMGSIAIIADTEGNHVGLHSYDNR